MRQADAILIELGPLSLREVDVGGKPSLACTLNQVEKGGARATPDQNDDSVMWLDLREPREIIPIAGNKNAASVVRKSPEPHRRDCPLEGFVGGA